MTIALQAVDDEHVSSGLEVLLFRHTFHVTQRTGHGYSLLVSVGSYDGVCTDKDGVVTFTAASGAKYQGERVPLPGGPVIEPKKRY